MIAKRILAVLLSTVLMLTVCTGHALADQTGAEGSVSEENSIADGAFQLNMETGEFTYCSEDFTWQSSPVLGGFDELASGVERTNQRSLIQIEYLDETGNVNSANSFTDAKIGYKKSNNGFSVEINFSDIGIVVPMSITEKDNRLTAVVKSSKIREKAQNKLISVTLLPYFGAGALGEDGYVFLPDGCGAIVSLTESNAALKAYEKPVYGENSVLYKNMEDTVEKQIHLPVFGIKRGQYSFCGIITEGDAVASVVSNFSTGYYSVASKFYYRQDDAFHLQKNTAHEKEVMTVAKDPTKTNFSVQYVFQKGENAGYFGMASDYRSYLIERHGLSGVSSKGVSLDLSFTATAEISKSFLGIPYTGIAVLTDFSDVEEVLSELENAGINTYNLSMKGVFKGGIYGKVAKKAKLCSGVGSLKTYRRLKQEAQRHGAAFFLLADFSHIYQTGNGVSSAYGAARDVTGAISLQYNYYPESFDKNEDRVWKLINAAGLKKVTTSFAKSAGKEHVSTGLFHTSDELYGDYRLNKVYDRADMLEELKASYERLTQMGEKLYCQGANIYVLPYSSMLSSIPDRSSQYDVFTEDVPFYQAVLHGLVDYSGDAVNLKGNMNTAVLKCIEYGAAIRYDLICQNLELLPQTTETGLFSSDKSVYLPQAMATDAEISDFYLSNADSAMVSHQQVGESVFSTEYANGNKAIVNYGKEDVTVGGVTVKAKGFALLTRGDLQ